MNNKKIWMWNHYATNMFFDKTGRHHGIAKYMIRKGHAVDIFCADTIHNSTDTVPIGNSLFEKKNGADGVGYVFVKTFPYMGNGISRVKNMLSFWRNVKKAGKAMLKDGKPDVIVASSVHPLTLVAGIQFSRKYNIPCICEVRDLWPLSLVSLSSMTDKHIMIRMLYALEKWIYRKADALVFTMEGGQQYIKDKGWDKVIDLKKVHHINNGVDLELFDSNRESMVLENHQVDNDKRKIVYAGAIRAANNVFNLVLVAEKLQEKGENGVEFLIYGDGPDKEKIEDYIIEKNLQNIHVMGKVDKKYVPNILSIENSINCLNYHQSDVFRYGASQNKFFEYLASGRPILANVKINYDVMERFNAGITAESDDIDGFIDVINTFAHMDKEEYDQMCKNARVAAENYDYNVLAEKLERIVGGLI